MDKAEFETIRDLLILLLVKSGVSYEAIAEATGSSSKTIQNKFPVSKVARKRENV